MEIVDNKLIKITDKDILNGRFVVPDNVTVIEDEAFAYQKNLKSIVIPNSVTRIGKKAFFQCEGLEYVVVPDSVDTMRSGVFNGCTNLKKIVLSNNLTDIPSFAFSNCSSLESIQIPNKVTDIGNYAFSGCDKLTNIFIPNSVKIIGDDAFSSCNSLKKIVIPNSVTYLGSCAFMMCEKLRNVTLSNSLERILDGTFDDCTSLRSITIPNSVTYIGYGAFSRCNKMISAVVPMRTHVQFNSFGDPGNDVFGNPSHYICVIRVPFTLTLNPTKKAPKKEDEKQEPAIGVEKINTVLNEIQKVIYNLNNLEIKPLNSESAINIDEFASELNDYPMIISNIFYSIQSLDPNLDNRNKKLNKLLNQISGDDPQTIFEKIGNAFLNVQDGELALNKDAIDQLKSFSQIELEALTSQNQILDALKEMVKLYIQKLKECQSQLDTTFVSEQNDELDKSDMTSLNNAIQLKNADLENQLLLMTTNYNDLNNAIASNLAYMTSLKEVALVLLPSIITEAAKRKIIVRKQESVLALKQVANILKQLPSKALEMSIPFEIPTQQPLEEVKVAIR